MSRWTEVRDAIEADVSSMSLSETAKQELTKNLVDNVMPAVDAWVDKLSAGLIDEAKAETGWNKIRDGIVLPYALRALVYLGRQVLQKTLENTVKA
ncbi:MAG: hypothetical protein SPL39_06315 [Selenomonadaceae bacterium]|nr:hypothetical protein [Selenomonadaceae bacterium]